MTLPAAMGASDWRMTMKVIPSKPIDFAHATGAWETLPSRRLEDGYDSVHEAAVVKGRYARCSASRAQSCCYGCSHQNQIPGLNARIVERRHGPRTFSVTANRC